MESKTFQFNGKEIAFEMVGENVVVNATEMAKVFNKDVYDFLRTEGTKSYIEAFCESEKLRFGDEFSPNGKLVKVVRGGEHNGTWMERSVALKFAAWLDPHFEVWVYKTIDQLLFGEYELIHKKVVEAAERKAEIEKLRTELQNDPNTDERTKRLFMLEAQEKKENKNRFAFIGKEINKRKQMILFPEE